MIDKTQSFCQRMRDLRPGVAAHQKKNARKRAIAIKLRDLRDRRGLTQDKVAAASGMPQSTIAWLEALSGPVPQLETIERYVAACGGHVALFISADKIERSEFAVA